MRLRLRLTDSALILAFLRNVEGSLGLDVYETGIEENGCGDAYG
jgi:hypothetical protein